MSSRFFITILVNLTILIFISACHSKKNKNLDNSKTPDQIEQYSKSLSPGTANITAQFVGNAQPDQRFGFVFQIVSVEGYGSSVAPLAIGDEVSIDISTNLFQNEEYKMFETDSVYFLQIRQKTGGVRMDKTSAWEIIKIIN